MVKKIESLTSLRFFAALFVVLYHTAPKSTPTADSQIFGSLRMGFSGVEFFFCLSGFILFLVYNSLDSRSARLSFFISRAARIYPVYVFSLFVDVPRLLAWRIGKHGLILGMASVCVSFLAQLFMLQVWLPGLSGLNFPSWSVATEVAFYAVFPFLVVKVRRNGSAIKLIAHLLATFSLVFMLALAVPHVGSFFGDSRDIRSFLQRNPIVRFPEFFSGMLLGALFEKWRADARTHRGYAFTVSLLPIASMLLIGFIVVYGLKVLPSELATSALLIIPFCGLIFGLAYNQGKVARLLSVWPLVFLGETSYSIYLLHIPIFNFFHWLAFKVGPLPYFLYLLILFLGSSSSYLLVERPLRAYVRHKGRSFFLQARGSVPASGRSD